MPEYSLPVGNKDLINIARRAFNLVDPRLIGHGARVSYLVFQMLKEDGTYTPSEMRNLLILAALHDIGAYKTEEIDRMVEFETKEVWNHSIYGYLFFHYFTPFEYWDSVVLYHHMPWNRLRKQKDVPERVREAAQILNLADRADIYFGSSGYTGGYQRFTEFLRRQEGLAYSPGVSGLFRRLGPEVLDRLAVQGQEYCLPEDVSGQFDRTMEEVPFTEDEQKALLRMLTYVIDFRSSHTVTHTITTTVISEELAVRMLDSGNDIRDVICAAMLHDLGKIGIPVEILEFPGKLSPQAMRVMRTHVDLTGQILGTNVSARVRDIALRHHEKLDGSGYPRGLSAVSLDMPQRIVAVADIISALTGTRSYKDAFSKEKTVSILKDMADNGLIDSMIVSMFVENYDTIMGAVRRRSQPILDKYHEMQRQYQVLERRMEVRNSQAAAGES